MKRFLILAILLLIPAISQAGHVDGYYRKNGTYVKGYDRADHNRKSDYSNPTVTASPSYSYPATTPETNYSAPSTTIKRDNNGRIERSSTAKYHYMKATGYPNGRSGYVVDHITPLACGGADSPQNMQWQTTEEAKAKDKWERKGCK